MSVDLELTQKRILACSLQLVKHVWGIWGFTDMATPMKTHEPDVCIVKWDSLGTKNVWLFTLGYEFGPSNPFPLLIQDLLNWLFTKNYVNVNAVKKNFVFKHIKWSIYTTLYN